MDQETRPRHKPFPSMTLVLLTCIGVLFLFFGRFILPPKPRPPSPLYALNDMRTIATALDAYRVDHGAYPPPTPARDGWTRVPTVLTTPVKYLSAIPPDRFARDDSSFGYAIIEDDPARWEDVFPDSANPPPYVLLAVGPSRERGPFHLDINMVYEPTNGIRSAGYIHHFAR